MFVDQLIFLTKARTAANTERLINIYIFFIFNLKVNSVFSDVILETIHRKNQDLRLVLKLCYRCTDIFGQMKNLNSDNRSIAAYFKRCLCTSTLRYWKIPKCDISYFWIRQKSHYWVDKSDVHTPYIYTKQACVAMGYKF